MRPWPDCRRRPWVPELDSDPAWRPAAAFLLGYRGHTRRAYFGDIRAWYGWCAGIGLAPLDARRHHVDRWIAEQVERAPDSGVVVAAGASTADPAPSSQDDG